MVSRYRNGAWSAAAELLAVDDYPQDSPTVSFGLEGIPIVFFVRSGVPDPEQPERMQEHLVVTRLSGEVPGTWTVPVPIVTADTLDDLQLCVTPDGHTAALWAASSDETTDLWTTVYDPASGTYSKAVLLTKDRDQEREVSAAWDPAGNVSAVYIKRRLTPASREATGAEGGTVLVPVLAEGANDLYLLSHRAMPDLAVTDADLAVDPPRPAPGQPVQMEITVHNLRALAARSIQVRFYDGDPIFGGTPISSQTVSPLDLVGGGDGVASASWTIPSDGESHQIVVVVDPDGAIAETDETNNTARFGVSGLDLSALPPYYD